MDPAFQKSFLRDFPQGKTNAVLALFGKHPAWDDHMDDLGLSTASLRTCKRLLYIQGIAANAARQQSLSDEQASGLLPYRHSLLWIRDQEMILLRLVESEDGRGRGFFPLLGAVHVRTANPEDALARLLTPLRTFVDRCRTLRDRDEVREFHRHTQASLQAELRHLGNGNAAQESPTPEELDAMQRASTEHHFVRAKIPLTRYDLSKSLGALIAVIRDQPILLVQHDMDPAITVCFGHPGRDDFWFLRI